MPYPARHILATLMIALHAAIAVCGPGLHAGPGLSHAGQAAGASRAEHGQDQLGVAASPTEHCPLCDYFAQGQLPFPPAVPRLVLTASPFEPTPPRVEAPPSPPISTRSRAPPQADRLI